jgi:FlaA1/EpsC-like NDP-sugar epimerase
MHNAKPNSEISSVAMENLLGRRQACLVDEHIREGIRGKVVLVTGAAGSIGSDLCRQIAGFGPLALVGFDQAETPLFQLEGELHGIFPGINFRSEIGDINRLDNLS